MSGVPIPTSGWLRARRAAGLLALAAIGGLIGFQVFRLRSPKPSPVPEASAGQLVLRQGRMYRRNQSEPFTGALVERYPNGTLKSRSRLVAGFMDGISEGWYTNGQMEVREHFQAGVSHGLRTKWYEQGKLLSETTIREGEHDGTFRRWHENGQLAEAVEMKQGHPEGVSSAYYPSGHLKARAQIQNGQLVEQKFWKDGELPPASAAKGTNRP